jgi:hypothetical protein
LSFRREPTPGGNIDELMERDDYFDSGRWLPSAAFLK